MIALAVRFVILIALVVGAGAQSSVGSAGEAIEAVSVASLMADGADCQDEDAAAAACFAPCVGGCATLAAIATIPGAGLLAHWTIDQRRVSGITSLPLPMPPRF